MPMPPDPLPWPEPLAWILPELRRTTFQEKIVTRMDSGQTKTRPAGRKFNGYEGVVDLGETAWAELQGMVAQGRLQRWRITTPDAVVPAWVVFRDVPFVQRESFTFGGPTTRTVRIRLAILVESATLP